MGTNYFDIFQILPAIFWLIVIYVIAFIRRKNIKGDHGKYYLPNVTAKLVFALIFTLYYQLVVGQGGGDSGAYFDGAITLNNLFWKSPSMYFHELLYSPDVRTIQLYYDTQTGFPPGWIYKEPQSFIVSKITSLFTFFTFRSYLATTFLFAFITANASWRLYEFVLKLKLNSPGWLAIATLLLPSANFWCSGVSKDTIVITSIYWVVTEVFKVLVLKEKISFSKIILISLGMTLIFNIRTVIFAAVALPLLISILNVFLENRQIQRNAQTFIKITFISAGLIILGRNLIFQSQDQFMQQSSLVQQAAVTQNDFEQNELYTGKKYSLGTIEFSPLGLVRVAPFAIIAGILRPFPWEALSPSLIFNGLECTLFFYLIFKFFKSGRKEKISTLRSNEFLRFSLTFVLLLGFVVGLTSGLFGVLVRLRAPILAFLLAILTLETINLKKKKA